MTEYEIQTWSARDEVCIELLASNYVAGVVILREEEAFPGAMMMGFIEVCSDYRGIGLGRRLYQLALRYAAERRRWLLPMPDLTEDGFGFWLKHDASALHEVLTHPASRALVEFVGGELDRYDQQVRAIASFYNSPPR